MVDSLTWFDGIWLETYLRQSSSDQRLSMNGRKQTLADLLRAISKHHTLQETNNIVAPTGRGGRRTPLTRRACGTSHRMIRKNSLFLKNWRSSKKDDRVVSPWENACPTQSKTLTHILDWLVVKETHQLSWSRHLQEEALPTEGACLMKRKIGDDQARAPGG